MQKITPCLWFDDNAEEAARFYASVFKNSKVGKIARYEEMGAKAVGKPVGSVMTVALELDGQEFLAMNAGPLYKFNEAVSFIVNCETQEEIDEMWTKLSEGGEEVQCGWLTDKFGLSWQVVPTMLLKLADGPDNEASNRMMQAMYRMKKINIATLEKAYKG